MFIKNGQVFGRERCDRTQRNPSVTPLEHKKDKIRLSTNNFWYI